MPSLHCRPRSACRPARYHFASQEASGGDQWYDYGQISSSGIAPVNAAAYSSNGSTWYTVSNTSNYSYVPPNFTYVGQGPQVLRSFVYDNNTLDSSFTTNGAGRLVAVQNAQFTGAPGTMQLVEMFSYTTAGERNKKRLQVHENTQSLNLDAAYTYDTEGKTASVSYPSGGNTYTYSFDSLDRPDALTDQHSNQVVSSVQYNAANQVLSMNYFSGSETRQYNSLGQVTSIVASGSTSLNRTYTYPTGTNNGKISSMTDNISGETVTYQYDSLNRLISAAGSGWGENYGYDAFGNLLSKTPTAGSPPTLSIAVNTANNQVVGYPYDANGNLQAAPSLGTSASLTYDSENRIVAAPGVQYGYDSQNKRVWVATLNSQGQLTGQTAYFYGVDGSMLAAYTLTLGSSLTASEAYTAVYFRKKRVVSPRTGPATRHSSRTARDRKAHIILMAKTKARPCPTTSSNTQRTGAIPRPAWITPTSVTT